MSSSSGGSLGSGGKKSGGIPYFIGRVKSIVLNPYLDGTKTPNPDYQSPADYGKIRFEKVYGDITQTRLANENDFAYPMFSFVKQLPLINEIVAVFYGPSPELNDYKENQLDNQVESFNISNKGDDIKNCEKWILLTTINNPTDQLKYLNDASYR